MDDLTEEPGRLQRSSASMPAPIVSNLSLAPVLRPRARLAWAGA